MRFVCLLPVSSLPCRYRPSACFRRASLRAWARPSAPLRERRASSPLREFSFRVPLLFLAFFDFGYKNTAPNGAVKLLSLVVQSIAHGYKKTAHCCERLIVIGFILEITNLRLAVFVNTVIIKNIIGYAIWIRFTFSNPCSIKDEMFTQSAFIFFQHS